MKLRNLLALPAVPPASLPSESTGFKPGELTWERWERETQTKYPMRWWLNRTLPWALRRLHKKLWSTPIYWLRTHTWNRYHLIDARNARNGYKWGWCDRGELILFASFALLVAFVEEEYPGHVDWDYDEEHRRGRDEFLALYRWWTKERKEEHDSDERLCAEAFGPTGTEAARVAAIASSCALDDKDDEMLHRLIAVRELLWT